MHTKWDMSNLMGKLLCIHSFVKIRVNNTNPTYLGVNDFPSSEFSILLILSKFRLWIHIYIRRDYIYVSLINEVKIGCNLFHSKWIHMYLVFFLSCLLSLSLTSPYVCVFQNVFGMSLDYLTRHPPISPPPSYITTSFLISVYVVAKVHVCKCI